MTQDEAEARIAEIEEKAKAGAAISLSDILWLIDYFNYYRANSMFTGDFEYGGV